MVVAAALHDAPWREEDRDPLLDPKRRLPYAFTDHPPERKQALVERGVAALAVVDPEVARLVRGHFESLELGSMPAGAVGWIRWLDLLSLALCLTAPGADPTGIQGWLTDPLSSPPASAPLALAWLDEGGVRLHPWPLAVECLEHVLPYRDLPREGFERQDALTRAWRSAPEQRWRIRIVR